MPGLWIREAARPDVHGKERLNETPASPGASTSRGGRLPDAVLGLQLEQAVREDGSEPEALVDAVAHGRGAEHGVRGPAARRFDHRRTRHGRADAASPELRAGA